MSKYQDAFKSLSALDVSDMIQPARRVYGLGETLKRVFVESPDSYKEPRTPEELKKKYEAETDAKVRENERELSGLSAIEVKKVVGAAYGLDKKLLETLGNAYRIRVKGQPDRYILVRALEGPADEMSKEISTRVAKGEKLDDVLKDYQGVTAHSSLSDIPSLNWVTDASQPNVVAERRKAEPKAAESTETKAPTKTPEAVEDKTPEDVETALAEDKRERPTESAQDLFQDKTVRARYQALLKKVYGTGTEKAESVEKGFAPGAYTVQEGKGLRIRNEKGRRQAGIKHSGERIQITAIKKGSELGGEFAKKGKERVWGQLDRGSWVALSTADGVGRNVEKGSRSSVKIPRAVAELFAKSDARSRAVFSTEAFRKDAEAAFKANRLTAQEYRELLGAAQVIDMTIVGKKVPTSEKVPTAKKTVAGKRVSADNRFEYLERAAIRVESGDQSKGARELFQKDYGVDPKTWTELYQEQEKKTTDVENSANKEKMRVLLGDGLVYILRIDPETHGGKQRARIEAGDAQTWQKSLDTPQQLRGDKEYVYRYRSVETTAEKDAMLAKYFARPEGAKYLKLLQKYKADPATYPKYFTIAQIELPNCQNPTLAIKPLADVFRKLRPEPLTPPIKPAAPDVVQPAEPCDDLSLAATFRDPAELRWFTALFRSPDMVSAGVAAGQGDKSRSNHRLDPQVKDAETGSIVRASELIEARKSVKIKPKAHLHQLFEDTLRINWQVETELDYDRNAYHEKFGDEWEQQLERSLKRTEKVLEGGIKVKKTREEILGSLMADLKKISDDVNAKEADPEKRFVALAKAIKVWRAEKDAAGYSDRSVALAERLFSNGFLDMGAVKDRMHKEAAAFNILKFGENWHNRIGGGTDIYAENDSEKVIEKWTLERLVREGNSSLYQADVRKMCDSLVESGLLKQDAVTKKYECAPQDATRPIKEVLEEVLYNPAHLGVARPPLFILHKMAIVPKQPGQFSMHELSSDYMQGILNKTPLIQKILQLTALLTGVAVSFRTGGLSKEAIEKYEKDGDISKLFDNPEQYAQFQSFLKTGSVDTGCLIITLPIEEWNVLLPGWRILASTLEKGAASCEPPVVHGNVAEPVVTPEL